MGCGYGLGMHQLPCIGNLVAVGGNVNQYSYIGLMGVFVLQQENALCHRGMAMYPWFKNNDIHKALFPPQSTDVNSVKNIWSCMKKDT